MSQREIFRVTGLPVLQNRVFDTQEEALASPTGEVVLVQDTDTGLVFNAAFDPDKLAYESDYQNEQAHSRIFQSHLSAITTIIDRHFRGQSVIEVGCGKGYFLESLQHHGYNITGIDPAYEGANPAVVKERFEPDLGLSADAIILRHVLEHMADPVSFLADICQANGGRGLIYIEVPCFDWICRQRAWFDIFYEHVNYFRERDFHRMFAAVVESGHVFGGQYLYVVADLASLRQPSGGVDDVDFPDDFLAGVQRACAVAMRSTRNAIWGGASKGVIFALYLQRAGAIVDLAIDINPAKQDKYLPGSGLRVWAPERAAEYLQSGDPVFVMNSNYLDEIMAQSQRRYRYYEVDHA